MAGSIKENFKMVKSTEREFLLGLIIRFFKGKIFTILKPEYSWVVQQIVRSANLGYTINLSVQK